MQNCQNLHLYIGLNTIHAYHKYISIHYYILELIKLPSLLLTPVDPSNFFCICHLAVERNHNLPPCAGRCLSNGSVLHTLRERMLYKVFIL